MQHRKSEKYDYLVKLIIIGDSGVGKTNLITRFCQNHFKDTYVATIGVDFKIKSLVVDGKKFKMQIWDTAGQQRFKNITQAYYKGAAGIILCYSITDDKSFQNVQKWVNQIENNAPKNVSKVLIGTKLDLEEDRKVQYKVGSEFAQRSNIPFVQVSSKTGLNVKNAFELLIQQIKTKNDQQGDIVGIDQKSQIMRGTLQSIQNQPKRCNC